MKIKLSKKLVKIIVGSCLLISTITATTLITVSCSSTDSKQPQINSQWKIGTAQELTNDLVKLGVSIANIANTKANFYLDGVLTNSNPSNPTYAAFSNEKSTLENKIRSSKDLNEKTKLLGDFNQLLRRYLSVAILNGNGISYKSSFAIYYKTVDEFENFDTNSTQYIIKKN